jgi:hypothetical protein
MNRPILLAAAALVLAACSGPPATDGYPADPEEQDKLCEAIGNTPNVAVPPRDRLFLAEHCTCESALSIHDGETDCGAKSSARYKTRIESADDVRKKLAEFRAKAKADAAAAEAAADEARRAAAAERAKNVAPARQATTVLRRAFWECSDSLEAQDCNPIFDRLKAECTRRGLRATWDDSSRDDCFRK